MNRVIKSTILIVSIFGFTAAGAGLASANPVPTPLPAPIVFTPEVDAAIVSALPPGHAIPDLFQRHIGDPAITVTAALTAGAILPPLEIERTVESTAPLSEQIAATESLFDVTTVTPDYDLCTDPQTFDDKVACGVAIIDRNDASLPEMGEVHVITRYGTDFVNPEAGCIGDILSLMYCEDTIVISKPMMTMITNHKDDGPTVADITGVIAHENGHRTDDLHTEPLGGISSQIETEEDVLEFENNADRWSGWVIGNAVLSGDLPESAIDEYIVTLQENAADEDSSHGGKETRKARFLDGLALAGVTDTAQLQMQAK